MKKYVLPGIFLVLIVGCASLPQLEIGKEISEDQKHYYYDVDSQIAYSVNKDDDYIYISLKTDNESTIRSLFRQGLYIYLDPNGRKSNDIYFNYPLTGKMGGGPGGPGGGPGMMPRGQMQNEQGQQNKMPAFDVNELIESADMEAIFSYKDLAEKLPVYSQKTDIAVSLTAINKSNFHYELRMPIDRLEKNDVTELSIGIETGEMEMPSMGGGPGGGPGGPGGGMGGPGGNGGSMPSGGMQGGAPGGPGGDFQGQKGGMNMPDIDIWFKVILSDQNN